MWDESRKIQLFFSAQSAQKTQAQAAL